MRQDQLVEAISEKRDKMIKIGMAKGLLSEDTLRCSQELDDLLNLYLQLKSKPTCTNTLYIGNHFFESICTRLNKYLAIPSADHNEFEV
jgi:hypothetical protein